MGEIATSCEVTPAETDGWQVLYTVRRNDGRMVEVEASCLRGAEEAARAAGNELALSQMANQCAKDAIRFADSAPAGEGVFVKLWFDTDDGGLRSQVVPPRTD